MFDLNLLGNYLVLVVVGICVCIGYVIKTSFSFIENKYIPCIMALLGCALNVWISGGISPEVILGGLFSGLASTGLHQAFKNLIEK
ncbi:MAG: phage holin family protein [Clostridium sp.]|jgi:hypothetical protein